MRLTGSTLKLNYLQMMDHHIRWACCCKRKIYRCCHCLKPWWFWKLTIRINLKVIKLVTDCQLSVVAILWDQLFPNHRPIYKHRFLFGTLNHKLYFLGHWHEETMKELLEKLKRKVSSPSFPTGFCYCLTRNKTQFPGFTFLIRPMEFTQPLPLIDNHNK